MYNRNITKRKIKQVLKESYTYSGTETKNGQVYLVYKDGEDKKTPVSFSKEFLDSNHENISKILKLIDGVLDYMNTDQSDSDEDSGDGFGGL